jgi:hypothetical protein
VLCCTIQALRLGIAAIEERNQSNQNVFNSADASDEFHERKAKPGVLYFFSVESEVNLAESSFVHIEFVIVIKDHAVE